MTAAGPPPAGPHGGAPPEDELMREQRAAYEAELARITVADMVMQATVSLLNLAAHRLAPEPAGAEVQGPGRDLEQVRDAIDAVRGLLDILERRMPGELKPLRDALSQLQMAYAAEVGRETAAPAHPKADVPGAGDDSGDGAAGEGEPGAGGGDAGGEPGAGGGEPGAGGGGQPGGGDSGGGGGPPGGEPGRPGSDPSQQRRPGPAESSGRLWVPGR